MKTLLPLLLSTLLFTACGNGPTANDNSRKPEDCYALTDTTTFGELGSWYQVAMASGKVNKLECFEIDTTGMADKIMSDLSFTIGRYQYRGATKCRYDISADYRKLYNFNCNGDTTGDTLTYEIAHLDREYLVLIQLPDTVAWKDAKPLSVLYMRK